VSDRLDPADADLAQKIRELPVFPCSEAAREQGRTALLAAVAAQPVRRADGSPRRWLLLGAAAAATLVAAGGQVLHRAGRVEDRSSPGAAYRGRVVPHPGARFQQESGTPDEIIRLTEGTIRCQVERLRPGERFRVMVGDAEVEARGTAFVVSAAHDRLQAVVVQEGTVVVGERGTRPARVSAGQEWKPTGGASPDSGPPPGLPPGATPPRPVSSTARSRRTTELAFEQGWRALERDRSGQAARAFARATGSGPQGSLAEDAFFWRAVALTQARRASEALAALDAFVARFPASDRAGEASAMAGWLLLDAGDLGPARQHFQRASGDQVGPVRRSAYAGLAAIERRQAAQADASPGP
jgi:TolA-binding protein